MATTALFAEILVVGLETAVWLSVLILAALGISVSHAAKQLEGLKELATPLTAGTLALAYVLGVIADRVSDSLYTWFRADKGVSHKRLVVMQKNSEIAKFLEYQRSRLRIARGTVVNLFVAVPVTALYVLRTSQSCAGSVGAVIGLVAAGAVAWFAAEKIHSAYMNRLSEAYELVTQPGPSVGD